MGLLPSDDRVVPGPAPVVPFLVLRVESQVRLGFPIIFVVSPDLQVQESLGLGEIPENYLLWPKWWWGQGR